MAVRSLDRSRSCGLSGLWEGWRPANDTNPLLTYTIVTGPSGLVSGDIHDRAPVILPASQWEQWLTGSPDEAAAILSTRAEPELVYHPVSRDVGSPKNDRADLVEPIAGSG